MVPGDSINASQDTNLLLFNDYIVHIFVDLPKIKNLNGITYPGLVIRHCSPPSVASLGYSRLRRETEEGPESLPSQDAWSQGRVKVPF